MKVKVRKEVVRCAECTHKNEFLYISDFAYGERLALYDDRKKYAYINLLEDEVYNDFVEQVYDVFREYNMDVTEKEQQIIVNRIFKIACDKINGEKVDFSGNRKCDNCGTAEFEDLLAEPEKVVDIELPSIEHNHWNKLNKDEKTKLIIDELKSEKML